MKSKNVYSINLERKYNNKHFLVKAHSKEEVWEVLRPTLDEPDKYEIGYIGLVDLTEDIIEL